MTRPDGEKLPPLGILTELEADLRERLTERGRFETFEPGDALIRQGEDHHALSVIVSGTLVVSCHAHGDYVELATLGPGHTVGEMGLLDSQQSSADVRVQKPGQPARVWTVAGEDLLRFLDEDVAVGYAVMKMLAKEMSRRLRQNSDHMLHQADELRTHFMDIDY